MISLIRHPVETFVPSGTPRRIIVALHGWGQTARGAKADRYPVLRWLRDAARLDEIGAETDSIVLYPESTLPGWLTGWAASMWQYRAIVAAVEAAQDNLFLRQFHDEAYWDAKGFNGVERVPVYLAGFSDGATACHRIAQHYPVAGVLVYSGPMRGIDGPPCNPAVRYMLVRNRQEQVANESWRGAFNRWCAERDVACDWLTGDVPPLDGAKIDFHYWDTAMNGAIAEWVERIS